MCPSSKVWVSTLGMNTTKIISCVQLPLALCKKQFFVWKLSGYRTDTCFSLAPPQLLLIGNIFSSCLLLTLKRTLVFRRGICLATNI